MIATRERQHGARLFRLPKYHLRVLPIGAIFGSNASGKTNFIKILSAIKTFVLLGVQPDESIPIIPYLLDRDSIKKPSCFSVDILIDNTIYRYEFSAIKEMILSEKLIKYSVHNENTVLFKRENNTIIFDSAISEREFLSFIFRATRPNQLFLTSTVFQNSNQFKHIYEWFKNIEIITTDSTYRPFEQFFDKGGYLYSDMAQYLQSCNIGIDRIEGVEVSIEGIGIDEKLKIKCQNISEGEAQRIQIGKERFIISKTNGALKAQRMMALHKKDDGTTITFSLTSESDGTLRIIDLFPAFADLQRNEYSKIYIIDEIDRSLHQLLIKRMITTYLDNRNSIQRGQLIFTTHDSDLMDQRLLRRDEIWCIDNKNRQSSFIAFSDFKDTRNDKDIRKSYLEGRLGGISIF